MRVLLCTLPQKTHFLTMVPLAWALRSAGHEVLVACVPGFSPTVTGAGLTAVPVGHDPDPALDTPEDREAIRRGLPPPYNLAEQPPERAVWTAESAESYQMMVTYAFAEDNATFIDGLVDFARSWRPDLVIWEPFTYAGAIAAGACGAAHARLLFTTDVLGFTHDWVRRSGHDDPLAGWLTETAHRHGFAFSPDLVSGRLTIDQVPPSLGIRADLAYLPMRYVPYGGPAVVPRWLREPPARPRVALTLGLSATEHFNGYTFSVAGVLDALADLDVEVVATIPESERHTLGAVPGNARIVGYVPLHALAPTCAAVIHHGGFGTLTTVALHGVPQLALPYHFEGPLLASRLAEQGAGLAVHSDLASGEAVREGLLRLLKDPAFTERAVALRSELLAMPTPKEVVPQLEGLVQAGRPTNRPQPVSPPGR